MPSGLSALVLTPIKILDWYVIYVYVNDVYCGMFAIKNEMREIQSLFIGILKITSFTQLSKIVQLGLFFSVSISTISLVIFLP